LKRTDSRILDGFNQDIIPMIVKKYDLLEIDAMRVFIYSKTYQLLLVENHQIWHLSAIAIFDLWENEYLTGDLGNSLYVRGDEL